MRKNLELAVKILLYCTFFVPIVVMPTSFIFPFIVPKILAFRILVTVAAAGYSLLLLINWQDFRPRLTPLTLCVTAFLLSFGISTFVGVDAYHSFWDNHERMLGLFTLIHYAVYYFVCTSVFKKWSDWQMALRIFLVAGSVVMVVGILQVGNPELLLNQGHERVASTLGNPIYVGGYGLFLMFVAALLFLREKVLAWRWIEVFLGILATLGMFYSGTRGSMLGLVASVGVIILSYAVALKNYPRVRQGLWGVAVFGVALLAVLYHFRQTTFVTNIPAVGRAINTSFAEIKGSARFIAWRIAVESWRERPVFGWGPNNYFYAFNKHYNPASLNFGYGETWFDNAHNIIVNTLAVQGAFGLVTYLSLFGVGIASLMLAYRRQKINLHLAVIGAGFLTAHLVQNVTVFENPTSYMYFMFWLAFINQSTDIGFGKYVAPETETKNAPTKAALKAPVTINRTIGVGAISAAAVVAFLFIFIFEIQPGRANVRTLNALRVLNSSPVVGITVARDALAFNSPHIDDIRNDIARTATGLLIQNSAKLGKDKSNELFTLIHDSLLQNIALHPLDIRTHLQLAQLLQTAAQNNNDLRYLAEADSYLELALEHSPRRQQIIYSSAALKAELGKINEAARLLEGAITDNPKIGESYWRLAYLYKMTGQGKRAQEIIDLARKNNVLYSPQEEEFINSFMGTATSTQPGRSK